MNILHTWEQPPQLKDYLHTCMHHIIYIMWVSKFFFFLTSTYIQVCIDRYNYITCFKKKICLFWNVNDILFCKTWCYIYIIYLDTSIYTHYMPTDLVEWIIYIYICIGNRIWSTSQRMNEVSLWFTVHASTSVTWLWLKECYVSLYLIELNWITCMHC